MSPSWGPGAKSLKANINLQASLTLKQSIFLESYFLPLSSQKFLVLILLTSEEWKAESTLEPPNGFEHGTPGLGIQRLIHYAIAPYNADQ